MNRYTIYCTEEQTKKALELGAPISNAVGMIDIVNKKYFFDSKGNFIIIPTAEQMIGWLRTKGFAFGITEYNEDLNDYVSWQVENKRDKKWYISGDKLKSLNDAVIAAINAALDYLLTKNK